jgi:predicted metalloprotease
MNGLENPVMMSFAQVRNKFDRVVLSLAIVGTLLSGCRAQSDASSRVMETVTSRALPGQVRRLIGSLEDFWTRRFSEKGLSFRAPKVFLLDDKSRSEECGEVADEPMFYCRKGHWIGLAPGVYGRMIQGGERRDLAVLAMTLAHEYGHAVQFSFPGLKERADSGKIQPIEIYRKELHADFLSGYWYGHAPGIQAEEGDEAELESLMSIIGDPKEFLYPNAANRQKAFKSGVACQTNPLPLSSFEEPRC